MVEAVNKETGETLVVRGDIREMGYFTSVGDGGLLARPDALCIARG